MWIPKDDTPQGGHADGADGTGGQGHTQEGRQVKRKRGGGGAWRTHISKKLRAGEAMRGGDIAASYHSRTEEEVAQDVEDGRAATERHRHGLPSFGLSKRQEARGAVRNTAEVFNRRHADDNEGFLRIVDTPMAAGLAECTAENYNFLMKVVRKADF